MRWGVWILLGLAAVVFYLLLPMLSPFFIGFIIAYLFTPVVGWLALHRISRPLGTGLVFVSLTAVLVLTVLAIIPLLTEQTARLIQLFPAFLAQIEQQIGPWFEDFFGFSPDASGLKALLTEHGQTIGSILAEGAWSAFGSGYVLLLWVINLLLAPVVAFYLLRDWPEIMERLEALLPRQWHQTIVDLAVESDRVLGAFLRGQLSVMLANAAVYGVGLTLIGLNTGLIIGLVAGILSFIPYLGGVIGISMALIAAYIQMDSLWALFWVLVVFGVGQTLETVVWQPRFVGNEIGLHPVAVIFAVLAGGHLFGFMGVLLALPVSAVLMVLARFGLSHYYQSRYYQPSEPQSGEQRSGNTDQSES